MALDNVIPSSFTKRDVFYRYSAVFILAFILVMGSSYVAWHTQKEVTRLNQDAAISEAEYFISTVNQYRTFYSKVIVPAASKHGMEITHDYKNKDGTLPLPATFAKDFGEFVNKGESKFKIKLYSDLPFSWRESNQLDDFELNALGKLKQTPDKAVWEFQILDGEPVLRYAKADILSASCIACHNSYVGTPKTDWKEGDVRGALEIIFPMTEFESISTAMVKRSFLIMLGLIFMMVSLLFFILKKLSSSIKIAHGAYMSSERTNEQLHAEIEQREAFSHELEASEVKLRAIVDSVEEVIVVIDQRGIIIECNQVVGTVFGYRVDEVIGKNITMLMTSEHAPSHDAYIEKFIQHSKGTVMGRSREFFATRKNGEAFPIELFVNDARAGDDIIFTGTIRDVTERRKSEEIAKVAHESAVESAQLKSDFLANMSHEIRTPMNGVIGMTEMLLLSDLDESQQDLANTVKESAEALLVIINDILDYSKIEAGKLEIHLKTFNLLDVVESSLDLLTVVAEKKQLDIAFFIDESTPLEIESDPVRLRQIIINLLNNALKFTDRGYVILFVESLGKGQLKFSIIDTGIGIPEDKLATLFDMFSQVDSSMSREHGGTGLGLAICKQLVTLMGGEIGVTSTKNVGSTFYFNIDIKVSDEPQQPYIIAPCEVLMLNSEYVLSRYYKQQLAQWQMDMSYVRNINQLLLQLQKKSFALVAIDVETIFLDFQEGYGVLPVVHAVRKHCDSPIVLYAYKSHIKKLEELEYPGEVQLFSKPIKHSSIKRLLNNLSFGNGTVAPNPEISPATSPVSTPKPKASPTVNVVPGKPDDQDEGPKYHVLLAEDNRVNQKVAVAILGKFHCEVVVAVNGKIAVEMAKEQVFDIIFMDCQMPEMDGYNASTAIRAFSSHHHSAGIPIVAFTAHAMKDDNTKCKEAGMDDYLSKPINMDELKRVLSDWSTKMNERRARRTKGD